MIPLMHEISSNVAVFNNSMFLSQELVDDLYSFRDRLLETQVLKMLVGNRMMLLKRWQRHLRDWKEKEGGDFFVFHKFLWQRNVYV